jgi:hypothetical protein
MSQCPVLKPKDYQSNAADFDEAQSMVDGISRLWNS